MITSFGFHLLPLLVTIVVIAGVVLLAPHLVRRVHDLWHRK